MDKVSAGRLAEEAAVKYLTIQGYEVIQRNYRTTLGEIDIIAQDKGTLVFVEVRSRQSTRLGLPQETVNWAKQQKLRRVAQQYLKAHKDWQRVCRFDVIGVLFDAEYKIKSLEQIRDAF
jgi:putative endonuclease